MPGKQKRRKKTAVRNDPLSKEEVRLLFDDTMFYGGVDDTPGGKTNDYGRDY